MHSFCLILTFTLLVPIADRSASRDQSNHQASLPDVQRMVDGQLKQVSGWNDIPRPVRDSLTRSWKGAQIADVHQPFNATCTGSPDLPFLRLVLAAKAPDAWLVCYESGGIAHSFHLAIVAYRNEAVKAEPVLISLDPMQITDLGSLRKAVHRLRSQESQLSGDFASDHRQYDFAALA